jgi:hypothetical protein
MGDRIEMTVETTIKSRYAKTLLREAEKRSMQPVELLALILEIVLKDNLVAAVVDAD